MAEGALGSERVAASLAWACALLHGTSEQANRRRGDASGSHLPSLSRDGPIGGRWKGNLYDWQLTDQYLVMIVWLGSITRSMRTTMLRMLTVLERPIKSRVDVAVSHHGSLPEARTIDVSCLSGA